MIRDRLPNIYLREQIEEYGDETIVDILATHLISRRALEALLKDPFTPADFEDFVTERKRTILELVTQLVGDANTILLA